MFWAFVLILLVGGLSAGLTWWWMANRREVLPAPPPPILPRRARRKRDEPTIAPPVFDDREVVEPPNRAASMGRYDLVARRFAQDGEHRQAAAHYKKAGLVLEAAEALDLADGVSVSELAQAWRAVLKERFGAEVEWSSLDADARQTVRHSGVRAVQCLRDVGHYAQAAALERQLRARGVDLPQTIAPKRAELPQTPNLNHERYAVGELLGEGGVARVFRARDRVLERPVALKFLTVEGAVAPERLERFQKEARVAAGLNHSHIVTVYDVGMIGEQPFICMEYIDGMSLGHMLDQARTRGASISMGLVLQIARDVLDALVALHDKSLVHRDLKPSNVMVTREGVVKLMDFGVASSIEPLKLTRTAGTPAYMAPEQYVGHGIDHRTDLFALGIILYEMVTLKRPYKPGQPKGKAVPARELRPNLPERLEDMIRSCIDPRIARRPRSAVELLECIEGLLHEHDSTDATLDPAYIPAPQPTASAAPRRSSWRAAPVPTDPNKPVPFKAQAGRASPLQRPTQGAITRDVQLSRLVSAYIDDKKTRMGLALDALRHPTEEDPIFGLEDEDELMGSDIMLSPLSSDDSHSPLSRDEPPARPVVPLWNNASTSLDFDALSDDVASEHDWPAVDRASSDGERH